MSLLDEILAPEAEPDTLERLRDSRRKGVRVLRPGRTPAGIVVAAALTAVSWGLAYLAGAGLVGVRIEIPMPSFAHPAVPAVASALVILGGVLVVLALLPGRPILVPLETQDDRLVIGLTRRGLRRTLADAAVQVDGVDAAHVRIRRTQIEVTVITDTRRFGEPLREVGAAVGDRLAGLGVQCRHEVVVRLRRRGI
ncbi:hypothetical protein J5X84_00250 [Streptosporangiaceae bacterium NEAU-GS5]|nr:hypothetical protein [Streptosporangiaceae bacterium NEAU-GS5]